MGPGASKNDPRGEKSAPGSRDQVWGMFPMDSGLIWLAFGLFLHSSGLTCLVLAWFGLFWLVLACSGLVWLGFGLFWFVLSALI